MHLRAFAPSRHRVRCEAGVTRVPLGATTGGAFLQLRQLRGSVHDEPRTEGPNKASRLGTRLHGPHVRAITVTASHRRPRPVRTERPLEPFQRTTSIGHSATSVSIRTGRVSASQQFEIAWSVRMRLRALVERTDRTAAQEIHRSCAGHARVGSSDAIPGPESSCRAATAPAMCRVPPLGDLLRRSASAPRLAHPPYRSTTTG